MYFVFREYQSDETRLQSDSNNGYSTGGATDAYEGNSRRETMRNIERYSDPAVMPNSPDFLSDSQDAQALTDDDDDAHYSEELNRARRRWLSGYRRVGEHLGRSVSKMCKVPKCQSLNFLSRRTVAL